MKKPPISKGRSFQNSESDPIVALKKFQVKLKADWYGPSTQVDRDMNVINIFIGDHKTAIIADCKRHGWTGKEPQNFYGTMSDLQGDLKAYEDALRLKRDPSTALMQFNEDLTTLLTFMTSTKPNAA